MNPASPGQHVPKNSVISRCKAPIKDGTSHGLTGLLDADQRALAEMREFAARLPRGVAELARSLGLSRGTVAPALSGAQSNRPHSVLAAWAKWCATHPNHSEALIVRTVARHGIRLEGSWFNSPELERYIGLQVVVHRDGPDHVAVYAGRPLEVVARSLSDRAHMVQLPLALHRSAAQ